MRRILLVDDDAEIRDVIRLLLEDAGFTVVEAVDGDAAMVAFRAQPTDLLICDLFMPGQDGVQVINALHREFPQVKIIAISGGAYRGTLDMLPVIKFLGADEVLRKPVDGTQLLVAVRRLLGLPAETA